MLQRIFQADIGSSGNLSCSQLQGRLHPHPCNQMMNAPRSKALEIPFGLTRWLLARVSSWPIFCLSYSFYTGYLLSISIRIYIIYGIMCKSCDMCQQFGCGNCPFQGMVQGSNVLDPWKCVDLITFYWITFRKGALTDVEA